MMTLLKRKYACSRHARTKHAPDFFLHHGVGMLEARQRLRVRTGGDKEKISVILVPFYDLA